MAVISISEPGMQSAELDLERGDISFWNVARNRVRIEVVVHNRGTVRSEPTPIDIRSAPLGAFLPWQPLRRLSVPPIEPGSRVRLHTEVDEAPVAPLGEASRVPPAELLMAVGAADSDDVTDSARNLVSQLTRGIARRLAAGTGGVLPARLAPNLFGLLGSSTMHWAGNINVFVGQRSVERHVARALRIHPGKVNVAVFLVGVGRDAYSFALTESPLAPYAVLVDVTKSGSLLQVGAGEQIPRDQWLEAKGILIIALVLDLPRSCEEGSLAVSVRQRSTGRDALVEFSLDAYAVGPGCFTV